MGPLTRNEGGTSGLVSAKGIPDDRQPYQPKDHPTVTPKRTPTTGRRRRGDDRRAGELSEDAVEEAGEEFDDGLTKADAVEADDALQAETGRGA